MSRGRNLVRLKYRPLSDRAKRLLLDWDSGQLHRNPTQFHTLSSLELFGNPNPLAVEIGPGSGDFLCDQARSNPDTNFLGIEVSHRSAAACAELAGEMGLANLRILRADFKLLGPLLPEASWSKLYLHFPDPPHKNADRNRRIFDQAFLDHMARALTADGQISVASDKTDFFFEMLELAVHDLRFRLAHPEPYLYGFRPLVKSRFQLFWEKKGVFPLRFILRRT